MMQFICLKQLRGIIIVVGTLFRQQSCNENVLSEDFSKIMDHAYEIHNMEQGKANTLEEKKWTKIPTTGLIASENYVLEKNTEGIQLTISTR